MSKASYEDLEVRRQRAMDEAAAWLVRFQEAAPTAAERSSFTDWLRESPLHVAAMLRVAHTDSALAAFGGWDDVPVETATFDGTVIEWPPSAEGREGVSHRRGPKPRRALWGAVAACLVAGMGATLWWDGFIGGAVFQTTTGERRDVALQDGSTLRLGPETRVRVHLSDTKRDVALECGEAVFKVAKDPTRPFTVIADRTRVRAVGTEFAVEQRGGSIVVTVADGRVAVTRGTASVLPFVEDRASGAVVALSAGEQLAVPHTGTTGAVRKVDSASSLAWANGRLVFDNDPIGFVVERFNQYNRIRLVVPDPRVADRRLSGSFDATDLESFLAFLRSSMPVRIVRTHNGAEITIAPQTRSTERSMTDR